MFRKNTEHLQQEFFGFENELDEVQRKKLNESEYAYFYNIIFCNIKEDIFSVLYSKNGSRPNAAINAMVSALILYNKKNWTYDELFENIHFNLLVRKGLGLSEIGGAPFCPATLFNFQNLINEYWIKTGVNLLEQVFDSLTEQQLKELEIKVDIQRRDSFLIGSNIRNYSRLQLLIEVLKRVHRVLTEEDQKRLEEKFGPYIKKTSGQYVYKVKGGDLDSELEKIANIYHSLYNELKSIYGSVEIFKIFERVYTEHFTVVKNKVKVKPSEEMHSGCLQSPDDTNATYRKKGKQMSKGQMVDINETCNPENTINLLNDINVEPNNTDDSESLNKRIDVIKEKTPELKELHTDGAYGSTDNDRKMEELEVKHVQTAIRGQESKVEINIEKKSEDIYEISCPNQKVESEKTAKRNKACFDKEKCSQCVFQNECPAILMKNHRVFYFTEEDYLKKKRQGTINTIPEENKYLRNNVEATVKEFKKNYRHGKLKVRGRFKTEIFAYTMGIAINFGRIYRYLSENPDLIPDLINFIWYKTRILLKMIGYYSHFSYFAYFETCMNSFEKPTY